MRRSAWSRSRLVTHPLRFLACPCIVTGELGTASAASHILFWDCNMDGQALKAVHQGRLLAVAVNYPLRLRAITIHTPT